MSELGDFVRRHRVGKAMTQSQLACRVGVDATYISAIEVGKKIPNGSVLLGALAIALDLSADEVRALRLAADLSQRTFRLAHAISPAKIVVIRKLLEEVPQLTDREAQMLLSIVDTWNDARRVSRPTPAQLSAAEGGAM